jgi:tripartite-type tricarboxylate transporter receptor subunit TctC
MKRRQFLQPVGLGLAANGIAKPAIVQSSHAIVRFPRRQFLHLAAGVAALPVASRFASAQTYPARPVRIVAGFPPGGVTDLYARLIGQWLSERLGGQFFVENRAGAGGSIATESVVRAAPDGYTLLLAGSNDAWNATLYDNLKYNFTRDIAPVASVSRWMGVLVVHPSSPARSVPELIAYVKSNPGKLTIASSGVGSAPHVFWELFSTSAGVEMVHVPYRGEGLALTDLLGGQVDAIFATFAGSIEHIRAGKLRPLAVTAATRAEILPEVPTVGESVPGYEASGWLGVGVPRNTPSEIIDKLNKEINAGLAGSAMTQRIAQLGDNAFPSSPAEFGKFIAEYTDKWAKVIREANIKAG